MGFTGFTQIFASATTIEDTSLLKFSKFPYDAMNELHRIIRGLRNNRESVTGSINQLPDHLKAIINILFHYVMKSAVPIFVFDGNTPDYKIAQVSERKQIIHHASKRCHELEAIGNVNTDEYIQTLKRSFNLSTAELTECKEGLAMFGFPVVTAPYEADPQCAIISRYHGSCVVTNDSDVLLCGAHGIIKNIDFKEQTVQRVLLNDVLVELLRQVNDIRRSNDLPNIETVDRINLIDLGILLGTGYLRENSITVSHASRGDARSEILKAFALNNLDVISTLAYMNMKNEEYKSITCIDDASDTQIIPFLIPDNFIDSWEILRNVYMHPKLKNPEILDLELKLPDEIKIWKLFTTDDPKEKSRIVQLIEKIKEMHRAFTYIRENMVKTETFERQFPESLKSYRLKYALTKTRYDKNRKSDNDMQIRQSNEWRDRRRCIIKRNYMNKEKDRKQRLTLC